MAQAKRPGKAKRRRHYEDRVQCQICRKWFKALTLSHLQIHGLTPAEYKEHFGVDYLWSDQSRKKISDRNSRVQKRDRYHPRTKTEILQDVRRHARQRSPLTSSWLNGRAPRLVNQAMHAFGAWRAVLKAAKLEPKHIQRWSDDRIVKAIRRRVSAGRDVNVAAVTRENSPLYSAACEHFGSWRQAIEASGLDHSKVRKTRVRNRETVTRDLHAWVGEHGALSPKALESSDRPLWAAMRVRFGSLEKAARILGLPFYSRIQRWSKDRIKEEVQRRAAEGRSLRNTAVKTDDPRLRLAARRYFGSWGAAVEASGFDYAKTKCTKFRTHKTIGRDLRAWVREHGQLNATALEATDSALYRATRKLFGPIKEAARELGLPFRNPAQHWSPDRVAKEIKRRVRAGRPPDYTSVRADDRSLCVAARAYFGSWRKATQAPGFDYERISRYKARTREMITRDFRAWVRKHGPLSNAALQATDNALRHAVRRRFGSLERAARELGLPYQPAR